MKRSAQMTDEEYARELENYARGQAILAMRRYCDERSVASDATAKNDAAALIVRRWLDQHHEALVDGELGWRAEYQTKELNGQFDFATMPEQAIVDLARAGAFTAASKSALDAITKSNPRIHDLRRKYQMPGGQQQSLEVRNKTS